MALKFIQLTDMPDKYFCEFKVLDYILGFFGLFIALRKKGTYFLFIDLFLASLVFMLYPYRFFSAQGFLPVIFLVAVFLDSLYERFKDRTVKAAAFFIIAGFLLLLFSPTILMQKNQRDNRPEVYLFDSVSRDMLFPLENERIASVSLWKPDIYLQAVRLIKKNSDPGDIIYANSHILSACLASLSGRANASALFPEIGPVKSFSPFKVARIIALTKDNSPAAINYVVAKYRLRFLGENRFLVVFSNPSVKARLVVPRAGVPFWAIGIIAFFFCAAFVLENRIIPKDLIKNI